MAPRRLSRYTFTQAIRDADDRLVLYGEEPYRFRDLADNRRHLVKEGDTLFGLASLFFRGFPRPAGLWWVIADFQPEPIHDPTRRLAPGRVLVIPSMRTVQDEVLSERRRRA